MSAASPLTPCQSPRGTTALGAVCIQSEALLATRNNCSETALSFSWELRLVLWVSQ